MAREPAMSPAQALLAVETGITIACELADSGVTLLGIGEMGIGNSTAASALTAVLTGTPVARVTGRGTGVADEVWRTGSRRSSVRSPATVRSRRRARRRREARREFRSPVSPAGRRCRRMPRRSSSTA
jgi:hypothetical protein